MEIIDGRKDWSKYTAAIMEYAAGSTHGIPNLDQIMRSVVEENLEAVRQHLLLQSGVVTKHHVPKEPTSRLWQEFEKHLRERALRQKPGYVPMALPLSATKHSFERNRFNAYIDHNGKYQRTFNADVHHIWPETLGGPTTGWNLVSIPPFAHHDMFHPILDQIVRRSEEGQPFRLL